MRRTKKEFITHYEDKYFTVEFYHGERGTFFGSRGIEDVIQTVAKCSMHGGICFTFPGKYQATIWKMIGDRERQIKGRIDVGFFEANVPAYVSDIDDAENK